MPSRAHSRTSCRCMHASQLVQISAHRRTAVFPVDGHPYTSAGGMLALPSAMKLMTCCICILLPGHLAESWSRTFSICSAAPELLACQKGVLRLGQQLHSYTQTCTRSTCPAASDILQRGRTWACVACLSERDWLTFGIVKDPSTRARILAPGISSSASDQKGWGPS